MRRVAFLGLVTRAFRSLPGEFRPLVVNTVVLVESRPSAEQLRANGIRRGTLLGLYEGVPHTERGELPPLYPDRITLFQAPIEAEARASGQSTLAVIRTTLAHEIGHHFGLGEAEIRALERCERHEQ